MPRSLAVATFVLIASACDLCGQVLVNQSGYNAVGSKRFTAPLAADGIPFTIITEPAGEVVFSGTITSGVGDFSALEPAATGNFRVLLGSTPNHLPRRMFRHAPRQ